MANAAAAKAPPRPMSADMAQRIERLLKGAIDMHCHSGPSVMPRRLDHIDAVEEAAAAGMKALLFKDHYSDLGQIDNPTPVTGFRAVIRLCIEQGYDDDQIRRLVGGNAGRLLGLDEPRRDA